MKNQNFVILTVILCVFWFLMFFVQTTLNYSIRRGGPTYSGIYFESPNLTDTFNKGWYPAEYISSVIEEGPRKYLRLEQVSSKVMKFPLLELSKGNIPAILVRQVLSSEQIFSFVRDIGSLPKLGTITMKRALKISRTEKEFARILLNASLNEKDIVKNYSQYNSILASIQRAFASLADKEDKKLMAQKGESGYEIASIGFRTQGAGVGFPTHFDSLQANEWESKRKCGEKKTLSKHSYDYVKLLPHFSFENLLSMVVMISTDNSINNVDACVRLYKCSYKDLQKICLVKGRSHQIGANLLGFSKWAAFEKIPQYDVKLKAGDMYIFNANFVHEIVKSKNRGERLTVASFLSYDQNKNEILPWI